MAAQAMAATLATSRGAMGEVAGVAGEEGTCEVVAAGGAAGLAMAQASGGLCSGAIQAVHEFKCGACLNFGDYVKAE